MALDLMVAGTSLNSGTISRVVSWDGVFSSAPLRGSNLTIPGLAGDIHQPKVRGAFVFTVPLVLLGSSWADMQDRLNTLRTLLDTSAASKTATRVRPTGAGDVMETCQVDYLSGLEPAMVNLSTGRVALDLVNLSGVWA